MGMGDVLIFMLLVLVGTVLAVRYRGPLKQFLRNDGVNPVEDYKTRRIKELKRQIEDDTEELNQLQNGEVNNTPI